MLSHRDSSIKAFLLFTAATKPWTSAAFCTETPKMLSKLNPFRKPDPKELVRKWKSSLRIEVRRTDREIQSLILEQRKIQKEIQAAVKRQDMLSAKILARSVVRLRRAVARQAETKANLLALADQLTQAMVYHNVANTIKSSTAVMQQLNALIKVPKMQESIKEMAKEMEKAGFIQETIGDAIDSALEEENLEEATEEAVDEVLTEIAGEEVAALARAPDRRLGTAAEPEQTAAEAAKAAAEDNLLMERLAGLRAS
jgi:charged multivesicular body protein 3